MRTDLRQPDQLRPFQLTPGVNVHAEGSVLVEAGRTRVMCTASVEDRVPPFLRGAGKGWVTAEYGMLPRATSTRTQREATCGQGGRPHAGDPAADRPLAAIGDAARGPRRADGVARLRRDTGRRRHTHRGDHRRVCRDGAGARQAAPGRRAQEHPRHRLPRRHQRRRRRRHADARPRLRGGLARRGGHERRPDRRRACSSRCRARPKRSRSIAPPSTRCSALAEHGIKQLVARQRDIVGEILGR